MEYIEAFFIKYSKLFIVAVVLVPFLTVLKILIDGSIPFWYDPARDLLLAWNSLHKPTLIGPPSGIPGIFYGPYWIWLLSIGLLVSKDPRVVDFLVLTLPYFILFPFFIFRFSKLFNRYSAGILWLLFILSFRMYAFYIWNPNLAPLLFLIAVYLVFSVTLERTRRNYLKCFLSGFTIALVLNFHISFGIGALIGLSVYYVVSILFLQKEPKNHKILHKLLLLGVYGLGIFVAFTPFMIFEYKHGFHQTTTLITTLTTPHSVVGLQGLSKWSILENFFGRVGLLFQLDNRIVWAVIVIAIGYLVIKRKFTLSLEEKKMLLFLAIISGVILTIYLLSKNPVWDYHFIATEVIFLLFLGILLSKDKLFQYLAGGWVIILLAFSVFNSFKTFTDNPYKDPTLRTKEHIVNLIQLDAGNKNYAFYAYDPAIYTFDYDYLLKWRGITSINNQNVQISYLVIPKTSEEKKKDFINYRTPTAQYQTVKTWQIPDGTEIVKRVKK